MKHASRVLTFVLVSVTTLMATAIAAVAEYPPTPPTSTAAPGQQVIVTPAQRAALAFTGSDLTVLWVGVAALALGLVLLVAARRRAAIRRRGSLAGVA